MNYSSPSKSSTMHAPLFEKSSNERLVVRAVARKTFADFVLSSRVTVSTRGDLIALWQTLINAGKFPAITCWADLYRIVASRDASHETVLEARKLWQQFKSQPVNVPPMTKHRRAGHA